MYYWNVKALAQDLKKGKVSRKEKLIYFCATFAFIGKFTLFISHITIYSLNSAVMDILPGLFITVWGVFACYKANKRGDHQNFLDRFFCLSFPIMIRLFVLIIVFLVVEIVGLIFIEDVLGIPFGNHLEFGNIVLGSLIELYYFLWLRSSFRIVSGLRHTKIL